jgi:hypothetical protein
MDCTRARCVREVPAMTSGAMCDTNRPTPTPWMRAPTEVISAVVPIAIPVIPMLATRGPTPVTRPALPNAPHLATISETARAPPADAATMNPAAEELQPCPRTNRGTHKEVMGRTNAATSPVAASRTRNDGSASTRRTPLAAYRSTDVPAASNGGRRCGRTTRSTTSTTAKV